jgi:polysaccharide pyruvyl transferase WcaK-like protein
MKRIVLFDTSIASENLGDHIIMRSVVEQVRKLAPHAFLTHVPTHEEVSSETYKLVRKSDLALVGGTNLLSSNMHSYNQWRVNLKDAWFLENVVLMGVGWWQYQDPPNWYTRTLLRQVLSSTALHSVRDGYTMQMLEDSSICRAVNTGCPTTWGLTDAQCDQIPHEKSANVLCTLTDYKKDREQDAALLSLLKETYQRVYFWPQGGGDLEYIQSLGTEGIKLVSPTLHALTDLLNAELELDYVGTRLHGGIFSMNHGRRSIILSIDNRAREMGKDLNLVTVPRDDQEQLRHRLQSSFRTNVTLPTNDITTWKEQFRHALHGEVAFYWT